MLIKQMKYATLIALFGAISIAQATTNKKLDLQEATSASNAIITAEVLSSNTVMLNDQVYTEVTLAVDEEIKGDTPSTIKLFMPGGSYTKGKFRVGETVAGVPASMPSQRGLYFLSQLDTSDKFEMVGYNQGLLTLSNVDGNDMVQGQFTNGESQSLDRFKQRILEAEAK